MGASTVVASNMQRMMKVCFMKGRRWENRGSRERKRLASPGFEYVDQVMDLLSGVRMVEFEL